MHSELTLRQGLENFRQEYKDRLSHGDRDASEEAIAFFESHDIAHVLFECDITLFGEGAVKIWTIFGTTLGFRQHIKGYKAANAFELSKDFALLEILKHIFRFLITIPKIIFRAKRMSKPWNWVGFESYLDTPILEIRKEFNIKVL